MSCCSPISFLNNLWANTHLFRPDSKGWEIMNVWFRCSPKRQSRRIDILPAKATPQSTPYLESQSRYSEPSRIGSKNYLEISPSRRDDFANVQTALSPEHILHYDIVITPPT